MSLFQALRKRISERAASAHERYWDLVERLAGESAASAKGSKRKGGAEVDADDVEQLLAELGLGLGDLEGDVALVRQVHAAERAAADKSIEHANVQSRKAAQAVREHDDERSRYLLQWEREHAELERQKHQAHGFHAQARAAHDRAVALREKLAAARQRNAPDLSGEQALADTRRVVSPTERTGIRSRKVAAANALRSLQTELERSEQEFETHEKGRPQWKDGDARDRYRTRIDHLQEQIGRAERELEAAERELAETVSENEIEGR